MLYNNIQKMLLSSNKENAVLTLTVDTSKSTTISFGYNGIISIDYGDGTKKRLASNDAFPKETYVYAS